MGLKLYSCCLATIPLVICATFCGLYWKMWAEANDYNDAAKALGSIASDNAYDACGLLDTDTFNTKWTVILQFNSILYLLFTIQTIFLCIGAFFWPCCVCGGLMACFSGCAHIAAIIVTGVFRYQS